MKRLLICVLMTLGPTWVALGGDVDIATRNQEIIRRCNELRNNGDLEGAAGCFAERLTHQGQPVTREQLLNVLKAIYTAFPDYHTEIHELIASGDVVVERSTITGTHMGVAKGRHNGGMLVNVMPTQRRFEIQHIHWWQLRDSKVIEHYAGRDDLGLMRQLGLIAPINPPIEEQQSSAQP